MRAIKRRLMKLEQLRVDHWTPPPAPPGHRLIGRGLLVPEAMTEAGWLEMVAEKGENLSSY